MVPIAFGESVQGPNPVLNDQPCEELAFRWCPNFTNGGYIWCFGAIGELRFIGIACLLRVFPESSRRGMGTHLAGQVS